MSDCENLDDLLALLSDDEDFDVKQETEQDRDKDVNEEYDALFCDSKASEQKQNNSNAEKNSNDKNNDNSNSNDNVANEPEKKNKVKESFEYSESFQLTACKGCNIRVDSNSRTMSRDTLNIRLRKWNVITLKEITKNVNILNNQSKDFVIIGVLSNKSMKESSIGNKFLILTITDLYCSDIALFIFENDVINKAKKFDIGCVIAIATPKIMNNRKNKNNNDSNSNSNSNENKNKNKNKYNDIALCINENDQLLLIGKSLDFDFCKKMCKNGAPCKKVVNKQISNFCTYHCKQEYVRMASKRNAINRSNLRQLKCQNRFQSMTGKQTQFKNPYFEQNSRFKTVKNHSTNVKNNSNNSNNSNNNNNNNNKSNNTAPCEEIVSIMNEKDQLMQNYQKYKQIDPQRAEYYKARNLSKFKTKNNNNNNQMNDKNENKEMNQKNFEKDLILNNAKNKNKYHKRSMRLLNASKHDSKKSGKILFDNSESIFDKMTKFDNNNNNNNNNDTTNNIIKNKKDQNDKNKGKSEFCDQRLEDALKFVPQLGRGCNESGILDLNFDDKKKKSRSLSMNFTNEIDMEMNDINSNGNNNKNENANKSRKRRFTSFINDNDNDISLDSQLSMCDNEEQRKAILKLKGKKIDTPPNPNTQQCKKDNFLKNKEKAILCSMPQNNGCNDLLKQQQRKKHQRSLIINDNNSNNNNDNSNDIENEEPSNKKRRIIRNINGKAMTDEEIAKLINAKPKSFDYLKQKKHEKIDFETSILEETEKMNENLNQINNVKVKLYQCTKVQCPLHLKLFESKPHFECNASHGSMIKQFYGKKYFWQCAKCKHKTHTYNVKHNLSKCKQCGNRELVPASAFNVSQPKDKDATLRITSAQTELRSQF